MKHLMLDLETLGTSNRAVIIQLGACVFDPDEPNIIPSWGTNVSIDSCLQAGGEVNGDTIMWWLGQSQEARASVHAQPRFAIAAALKNLTNFYTQHNCKRIWSHGATFDIVIVKHYLNALNLQAPWKFYHERDTRTLIDIAESHGFHPEKTTTAHMAKEDSIAQSLTCIRALTYIKDKINNK